MIVKSLKTLLLGQTSGFSGTAWSGLEHEVLSLSLSPGPSLCVLLLPPPAHLQPVSQSPEPHTPAFTSLVCLQPLFHDSAVWLWHSCPVWTCVSAACPPVPLLLGDVSVSACFLCLPCFGHPAWCLLEFVTWACSVNKSTSSFPVKPLSPSHTETRC